MRNAGHMVPISQPLRTMDLVTRLDPLPIFLKAHSHIVQILQWTVAFLQRDRKIPVSELMQSTVESTDSCAWCEWASSLSLSIFSMLKPCRTMFFQNGPIPASFLFIFVLLAIQNTLYKFQLYNLKKWYLWLNPRRRSALLHTIIIPLMWVFYGKAHHLPTYLPTYLTKVPLIAGSINPENVWKRIGLFMPIFGHTDQGALSRGRDR